VPFPSDTAKPAYLEQMKALVRRHPGTTIIWAHTGVGRIVRPVRNHAATLASMLGDTAFDNLYFDISWTEVAKYLVGSPENTRIAANLINRYPDRFLFGTDTVAPKDPAAYYAVYEMYEPLWKLLTPEAREGVLKKNYERIFNEGRKNARAWEKAHPAAIAG